MSATPQIFRYLDYRSYLGDFFAHRRATAGLSHRGFARRAGFRSPNFIKLVIDGNRNLGPDSIPKIAKACELGPRERAYLRELVRFDRCRSSNERLEVLDELMAFEERIELYPLEREATRYFASWWVPVVRELSGLDEFRSDPAWVAECFGGRIDVAMASHALATLEALGLLHGSGGGNEALTSGDERQTTAMRTYHQQLLGLARDAIDEVPPDARDVSSITIRGDEETAAEAKRMVQRFRKELIALERRAKRRSQVLQFCLQLFPVAALPESAR